MSKMGDTQLHLFGGVLNLNVICLVLIWQITTFLESGSLGYCWNVIQLLFLLQKSLYLFIYYDITKWTIRLESLQWLTNNGQKLSGKCQVIWLSNANGSGRIKESDRRWQALRCATKVLLLQALNDWRRHMSKTNICDWEMFLDELRTISIWLGSLQPHACLSTGGMMFWWKRFRNVNWIKTKQFLLCSATIRLYKCLRLGDAKTNRRMAMSYDIANDISTAPPTISCDSEEWRCV